MVSVIFITNTDTKCPYQGITIKSDFKGKSEFKGSKWASILRSYLKSKDFDFCYFSYDYYSEIAQTLPCLSIVEIHDVIHLRNESFKKFGYPVPSTITKSQELSTLAEYDFVVCISQSECKYLQNNNLQNVIYLPPFIQTKDPVKHSRNGKYGFLGGTQLPNIEGLKQLPRSLIDDERFLIGGSISILREVQDLIKSPESNLGLLQNSSDFYEKVNLLLSPIKFGSGLKIKLLEALSFGLPILCTQHSIEGYPPGIEDIVTVHDEPEAWTLSIIDDVLNSDPVHILEYCKENFGYDRLREQIMQTF